MTQPIPGGRRRMDRVLADDYLEGLEAMPLEEVRHRRAEAEQEEVDLSYVRRLLQGRIDILRAEAERRRDPDAAQTSLVDRLASVLADDHRGTHGLGRHLTSEPQRLGESRRTVERLVADAGVSDVDALDGAQLDAAIVTLERFEHELSTTRRALHQVMDACSAEVARRYRDGEARVEDVLPRQDRGPTG